MEQMELIKIISIPLISALIGWGTNYLAVKMIFRPHQPVRFLGMTFHGLVPKRQDALAASIGEVVAKELVSHEDLKSVLNSKRAHDQILRTVMLRLDQFAAEKISSLPMVGMFLGSGFLESIKAELAKHIEEAIPEMLEELTIHLENHLDFKTIVEEKIKKFEIIKLEDIIQRIAAKELKAIEYWGGVLGFLVGLIQVAVVVAF
ncbi:DUF445 family protein [bacterium]|nr:DUF445 family protein [bacterium]